MNKSLNTQYGRASTYDLAATQLPPENLVSWAIQVPWANMAWDTYSLHLMHLRDLPGRQPLKINLPGATHEIALFAMQPGYRFSPVVNPFTRVLSPPNFVAQFIEADDMAAIDRVEKTVHDILDAELSPDTDYRQHWMQRFSASNVIGDPARFGETILRMQGRELVFDPAPLTRKPIDILCKFCKMPAVATVTVGDDICLRCCQKRNIKPKGILAQFILGQ